MSTEKPGAYIVRCGPAFYVGSTNNLSKRWHQHRKELATGIHRATYLQYNFNKGESLGLEIVYIGQAYRAKEQALLDIHFGRTGCANLCPSADSSSGCRVKDSTRAKHRAHYPHAKINSVEAVKRRVASRIASGSGAKKLTAAKVLEIRRVWCSTPRRGRGCRKKLGDGLTSYQDLCGKFGITPSTLHEILHRKIWAHV